MTQVVNIKDTQYIGRAGHGQNGYFGNPYRTNQALSRKDVINAYEQYFYDRLSRDSIFKQKIEALKGKILVCFCAPQPCHGDVIKEYLDSLEQ